MFMKYGPKILADIIIATIVLGLIFLMIHITELPKPNWYNWVGFIAGVIFTVLTNLLDGYIAKIMPDSSYLRTTKAVWKFIGGITLQTMGAVLGVWILIKVFHLGNPDTFLGLGITNIGLIFAVVATIVDGLKLYRNKQKAKKLATLEG